MKNRLWLIITVLVLAGCAGNVQWRESTANPSPSRPSPPDRPYLDIEHYQTTLYGEPGVKRSESERGVERPGPNLASEPVQAVNPNLPPFNDTPYWLVRVPAAIIAGHSDVWCPNSMNLLTSLIRLSGIADSTGTLRTIKLSPEKAPAPGYDQLVPLIRYEVNTGK